METMGKSFLQELECPVCLDYMIPPITMCENGHNICNNCKPKLAECPTCKGKFLSVRNRTAENIARTVEYPCRYRTSGCKEIYPLGLISEHEEVCPSGLQKCPFSMTWTKCNWTGTFSGIKKHIKDTHKDPGMVYEAKGNLDNWSMEFTKLKKNSSWQQAMFTLGEVFFRYIKTSDDFLYICMLYVGPKSKASNYKYKYTINSSDDEESISLRRVCQSYHDDVNEIIKNQECALFPYKFLQKCLDKTGNSFKMSEGIIGPNS